jgi:hypothetical protein
LCKNQADRAKTQWDARYGRAESEISRFFLLCSPTGREIRAALDARRSFRTVCKIFALQIGTNETNGLPGAEIRCRMAFFPPKPERQTDPPPVFVIGW